MNKHKMDVKKEVYKRQITICSKNFSRENGYSTQVPIITLSGKWLKQAGFKIGHVIDIHYEQSKLVITVAKNQRHNVTE